jgi:hypothetical protein
MYIKYVLYIYGLGDHTQQGECTSPWYYALLAHWFRHEIWPRNGMIDDWGRNPKLLGPSGCNSSGPGTVSMQSHVMTKHVAGIWLTSDDSDDGDY